MRSVRAKFLCSLVRLAAMHAIVLSLAVPQAQAEKGAIPRRETIKARLSAESSGSLRKVALEPLNLRGGSTLTLISPQSWTPLAEKIRAVLKTTHEHYSSLLGEIPAFSTAIRLMDEETFFAATGAPRWTNAMYYKNQIIIPLAETSAIDIDSLTRAVKHEYTHAVVHALSNGRCPGWLDEGLAQWAEGSENPALQPALRKWVRARGIVPLKFLQGGFTRLEDKMVPAAYAQSLYSAYVMLDSFGFDDLRVYLDELRQGASKADAFKKSFGLSESKFESQLGLSLKRWAEREAAHAQRES